MNDNFNEKAIKEYCKQCIKHSNLNDGQKELLEATVDAARNMEELIATGIVGFLGNCR